MQEPHLDRQWAVPGITHQNEQRLRQARVLVVGAGGLAHPVLAYLAGAGVQAITVVDFDAVDATNLPRQFYFGVQNVGQSKVGRLAEIINTNVGREVIIGLQSRITSDAISPWIQQCDLVVECSDDLALKYAFSRACQSANVPLIIGSVDQWQGQIVVVPNRDAAGFDDFFPPQLGGCAWGNCTTNGVIGSVVGVTGTFMANEAMKILLDQPSVQKNRMIIFDGLRGEFIYIRNTKLNVRVDPTIEPSFDHPSMKSISYAEMQKWREEGKSFQLIDVREQYEFDEFNIGGHLIPMNTVPEHVEAFSREIPVVVHCKAGSRSANVIRFLEDQYGFENLYNLEGGVLAVR